jgi:hypothetical protein
LKGEPPAGEGVEVVEVLRFNDLALHGVHHAAGDRLGGQLGRRPAGLRAGGNPPPTGAPAGTPEDALDCAYGLYLNDPSARI